MTTTQLGRSAASDPTSPGSKMGYRPALDGLRTVAIGLVLAEHSGLELFDGGNSGVIVFFVLSGFLITKLMLEEWAATDTLDIKAFYGRRTVRIMPAPLFMVVVVFALSWHLVPDPSQRRYLWFELFLVATYIYNLKPIMFGDNGLFGAMNTADTVTYMSHTWSLAIEEHFYLVWPFIFRGLRLPRRDPAVVAKCLLGLVIVITVLRFGLDQFGDPDLVSISFLTFDGFALGAALAFAIHAGAATRVRELFAANYLAAMAVLVLTLDLFLRDQPAEGVISGGFHYGYITWCGLASAAIISHLYDREQGLLSQVLSTRPMVFIGKLSYSLYLWHVPIQVYFSRDRFTGWSLWQIIVVEQIVTFAAAYGSYRLIEMQAARLRRRFVVKHEKPTATVAP